MTERFPSAFADFLTVEGKRILTWPADHPNSLRAAEKRGAVLCGVLQRSVAHAGASALESHLAPYLSRRHHPLPASTRRGWDFLPFSERRWGASLADAGSPAYRAAAEIGLLKMIESDSFHRFAEALSGYTLARRRVVSSLLCYGQGDYIGAHTDYGSVEDADDDEWVAMALSLGTPGQARQMLIWEGDDGLTEAADVAAADTVQALHLPGWHEVSPLIGSDQARRWVVHQRFRITGSRVGS